MSEINFNKFMETDMEIEKIANTFHFSGSNWSRNFTAPREVNAVVFFVSGHTQYFINGQTITVGPNQVLLLPTDSPYSGKKISNEKVEFYLVDFTMPHNKNALSLGLPYVITPSDPELTLEKIKKIHRTHNDAFMGYRLKMKSQFYDLIHFLFRDYLSTLHYSSFLEKINDCITKNISSSQFNVNVLASMLSVSAVHLRRLFKSLFGMPPHQYISLLRLENAKTILISQPDASLEQIADATGFANVYYFSNFFKKETGMTPVQYRKEHSGI